MKEITSMIMFMAIIIQLVVVNTNLYAMNEKIGRIADDISNGKAERV
jgi:hypothetical protein